MNHQTLLAIIIVFITLVIVRFLESYKNKYVIKFLQWVPAILFAYIIPAIFSSLLQIDLSDNEIHSWNLKFIIPLAIVTIMSSFPLKGLYSVGIKPVLHFLIGSFTIAVLPLIILFIYQKINVSTYSLFIEEGYWKGVIPIIGSWIGGSSSQIVLKEYVGTSENLFLSILVFDNIIVNVWTLFMFQFIKRSHQINKFFNLPETTSMFSFNNENINKNSFLTFLIIFFSIFIITVLFELSFIMKVLVLSAAGLVYGNFFSFWDHEKILKIGSVSIILVMATLGLKLNFTSFNLPLEFIIFILIWILSQFLISILIAYLLRISIVWVAISNMANLGGISTAPAVTSAYNKDLMPHAIFLAILSMMTGTLWGFFSVYLLEYFFM